MKTTIFIFIVFINYFIYSQTIKPLSASLTDRGYSNNGIYYKDIDNNFTPFIGSWKYTNGNQTFIVTFWKVSQKEFNHFGETYYEDVIFAHYSMYENYGLSNQQLLYTSNTNIAGTTQVWNTIFIGNSINPYKLNGSIYDVVGLNNNPNFPRGVIGKLSLSINPNTNPLTAQLTISKERELMTPGQPNSFVIPTNVVLTKM